MEDNEYKIKYESIEEFRRMASGNIARWEEQLSEIEGCLNRLLNMEAFQGESADAIRAYIQEVHITLVSAIRQCLREYSTRLLMYQSGYYKIDSDKDACLPEKEISDIGKHLQKQEEFLLERDESIRGILDEISDILPLPVPSQEKLLSDIGEVIKKSNKLNVDVRCYESEKAKEVTEEFTPLTESIKKAIQKYIGQERQLYGYVSGDADKVQEIAELNKKVMQSNWYMIENGADIQAALKEKGEQVEENQPVWYSQKYNAEEPDMHLILDLAGMMPAVGAVFDGINATWYLAEGDYTNAALSGMALIPVVGEFAGVGKAGIKGLKCADDIVDAVKALDNTKDVAKAVDDMAGTAKCLDDVIKSGSGSVKYSPINPCNGISQEVAESFNGATFTKTTLAEDTVMYRVSGGKAGEVGSYVSRTPQGGGLQSQLDLALNPSWGNTTENITKVAVPKGTTIYEGVAAPQNIYDSLGNTIGVLPGGGNQVYIPKVEARWFK